MSPLLPLIHLIYDSALHPERWDRFVEALSTQLGDAAVVLNMEIPTRRESARSFRAHSEADYALVFADLAMRDALPWPLLELARLDRFARSDEYLSDEELEKTELYRRYMEPQGFIAQDQIGCVLVAEANRPVAAVGIYRREGGRPLTPEDIQLLDALMPHMRAAYAIHCELGELRYRHAIVSEAIDRFPMGVVFVDRELRVVETNRAALRIAEQRDGFTIRDGLPQASVAPAGLARLIRDRLADPGGGISGSTFSIPRPSGRQPYEALVAPLISHPPGLRDERTAAVVFIADPEDQHLRMPQVLATLYNLTDAESELAALLSAGRSIDEAARERGVSAHTVRTQLKKIFAKTGVSRQADLVRLLSASVAGLEGDPD